MAVQTLPTGMARAVTVIAAAGYLPVACERSPNLPSLRLAWLDRRTNRNPVTNRARTISIALSKGNSAEDISKSYTATIRTTDNRYTNANASNLGRELR